MGKQKRSPNTYQKINTLYKRDIDKRTAFLKSIYEDLKGKNMEENKNEEAIDTLLDASYDDVSLEEDEKGNIVYSEDGEIINLSSDDLFTVYLTPFTSTTSPVSSIVSMSIV